MFIGDEREIVHINVSSSWAIVFAIYIWIWLSLCVTFFAVREQYRRRRWGGSERPTSPIGEEDYERYDIISEEEEGRG